MFALLAIKGNMYKIENNRVSVEITKEEAKRIVRLLTNCIENDEKTTCPDRVK